MESRVRTCWILIQFQGSLWLGEPNFRSNLEFSCESAQTFCTHCVCIYIYIYITDIEGSHSCLRTWLTPFHYPNPKNLDVKANSVKMRNLRAGKTMIKCPSNNPVLKPNVTGQRPNEIVGIYPNEPPVFINIHTSQRQHILKYVRLKIVLGDTKKLCWVKMKREEMFVITRINRSMSWQCHKFPWDINGENSVKKNMQPCHTFIGCLALSNMAVLFFHLEFAYNVVCRMWTQ